MPGGEGHEGWGGVTPLVCARVLACPRAPVRGCVAHAQRARLRPSAACVGWRSPRAAVLEAGVLVLG